MRRPNLIDDDALEIKMTPMIDVVFLLLVFFVWTSSFELPEFNLPSAVAQTPEGGTQTNTSSTPPAQTFDEIVIKIAQVDGVNQLSLNGQSVPDVATLSSKLAEIIELGVQPPVIVDPASEIQMSDAIEIYDAARLAGADRVLFAAESE